MAKKKKEVNIGFDSIYIMLNKSYLERRDPVPTNYDGNVTIDATDSVEFENCDEKGFSLKFTRIAELNTKSLFFVKVEYKCDFDFDEDSVKYFNGDIETIKAFAEDKKFAAIEITNVTNRASMMISFLTYQINSNPVITPPVYIDDTEE